MLKFGANIARAMGSLVNAFNPRGAGVKIQGYKLTKVKVNRLVERSLRKGGFRKKGKVGVNRITNAVVVNIRVRYIDMLDSFIFKLPGELDRAVKKASDLIKVQSFELAPRDTGRLERTARVTDVSKGDLVEYVIGYGPAIDPETGDDYTLFTHFGEYNRGPGTIDKNAEAGPMYLTRPMQKNTRVIMKDIRDAVRRAMRVA